MAATRIRIGREQLEKDAWRDVIPVLIALMGSEVGEPTDPGAATARAKFIADGRWSVSWEVEGDARDPKVRALFRSLDAVWPLWAHYTALDDSMLFVAQALAEQPDFTAVAARSFVAEALPVLADFYAVYGVSQDRAEVEATLLVYFHDKLGPALLH